MPTVKRLKRERARQATLLIKQQASTRSDGKTGIHGRPQSQQDPVLDKGKAGIWQRRRETRI